jgi:hypothetical protein
MSNSVRISQLIATVWHQNLFFNVNKCVKFRQLTTKKNKFGSIVYKKREFSLIRKPNRVLDLKKGYNFYIDSLIKNFYLLR